MSWAHDLFKALTVATAYTITFTPPLNSDNLILTFGDLKRKWGSDTHEILAELPPPSQVGFLVFQRWSRPIVSFFIATQLLFILGHSLIRCSGDPHHKPTRLWFRQSDCTNLEKDNSSTDVLLFHSGSTLEVAGFLWVGDAVDADMAWAIAPIFPLIFF